MLLEQFTGTLACSALRGGLLAQAIADAVRNGALGLGMMDDGELQPESVRYNIPIGTEEIHFTEDRYLLTKERAEELLAQIQVEPPDTPPPGAGPQPPGPGPDGGEQPVWPPLKPEVETSEDVKQLSLRYSHRPSWSQPWRAQPLVRKWANSPSR